MSSVPFEPTVVLSRAQALQSVAALASSRTSNNTLTKSQVLKVLAPIDATLMPKPLHGARLMPSPLTRYVAQLARVDVVQLSAVSGLPKHSPLTAELGRAWLLFQWQLLPLVDATYTARSLIGSALKARQSEIAGRELTRNEESNVRTRTLTALRQVIESLVSANPQSLHRAGLLAAKAAKIVIDEAYSSDVNWIDDRRRPNGSTCPGSTFSELAQVGLDELQYTARHRGWLAKASRLLRDGARGADPEDLVQAAVTHVATLGRSWTSEEFCRAVSGQLAKEAAAARYDDGWGHRPMTPLGGGSPDDGESPSEDRAQAFDPALRLAEIPEACATRIAIHSSLSTAAAGVSSLEEVASVPARVAALNEFSEIVWKVSKVDLTTHNDVVRQAEAEQYAAQLDALTDRADLLRRMGAAARAAAGGAITEATAHGHARVVLGILAQRLRAQSLDSF